MRDYLLRRVARIVPAYWLAFVALTALGVAGRVSLSTAPMYLRFLQIYFPRYAVGGLSAHFTAAATLKWSHLNPPFWVFFLIVLCLAATVAGKAVDEKRRRNP